jgi:hypothetical protein
MFKSFDKSCLNPLASENPCGSIKVDQMLACGVGLFTVWVPKKGKRTSELLWGYFFANNIYLKQF